MTFADLDFKTRDMGGIRATAKFPNGYEASVIKGEYTYGNEEGLYELAVLRGGHLCYDTPITDDVLGHLTEDEVGKLLLSIAELPDAVGEEK